MTIREKAQSSWDRWAVSGIYNDCEGNRQAFRRSVRAHYAQREYGLDPATIFLLVQMAIRLYLWAKQNGFLSAIPSDSVLSIPSFEALESEVTDDDRMESQSQD